MVDGHKLVRDGSRRLLEDVSGVELVADIGTGEEAVDLVRLLQPDVVMMDVQMPGIGRLEAIRRCLRAHPGVRVLAVTMYEGTLSRQAPWSRCFGLPGQPSRC